MSNTQPLEEVVLSLLCLCGSFLSFKSFRSHSLGIERNTSLQLGDVERSAHLPGREEEAIKLQYRKRRIQCFGALTHIRDENHNISAIATLINDQSVFNLSHI